MKKRIFNTLKFLFTCALVIGLITPINAQAAEQWTLQRSSKTLYLNEDNSSGTSNVFDFNFKDLPKNWKNLYKFNWTMENPAIATVTNGGVVTAVAVGDTKVYCHVTDKKTGEKVATAQATVVVKENAAKVKIVNKELDNKEVYAGEQIDLDRVMYNAAGKRTTEQGVLVTDYTMWSAKKVENNKETPVTDEVVIDQENGIFTMNKQGVYRLYVNVYQSSEYPDFREPFDFITVTVKEDAFKVKQTELNKVELSFSEPLSKLSTNKLFVQRTEDSYEMLIQDVLLSEDGKKAEVTFWEDMEHEVAYEITWKKNSSENHVDTWVASAGEPVTMELNGMGEQKNIVYVTDSYVKDNEIEIILRDKAGIDVTSLYGLDRKNLSFMYDNDKAYNDGFSVNVYEYRIEPTKPNTTLFIQATYSETSGNGKKRILAQATKTFIARYSEKTDVSQNNIENVGLYEEYVEYDDIVQEKLKTVIAANDDALHLITVAKNGWGAKMEQSAFSYEIKEKQIAFIDSDGLFVPLKKGVAHVTVFYTNSDRLEKNKKAVYELTIQITEERCVSDIAVNKTLETITGHVLVEEDTICEELSDLDMKAVYYCTVYDSFGENCTEYAYDNSMVELTNPEIFEIVGYDKQRKAIQIEVDGSDLDVIDAISDTANIGQQKVKLKTNVSVINENGKRISKEIAVLVEKPHTLDVKKYEVVAEGIDITEALDDESGMVAIKLYGLTSRSVKVADYSKELQYVKNLTTGKKLPEGSFFYTLSKNGTVINASSDVIPTSTHKVKVTDNNVLDFVFTNVLDSSSGKINVLTKSEEADYEVMVYQVTEKGCKMIQKVAVPVKNTSSNALVVKQVKTESEQLIYPDISGWTVRDDITDVIHECYRFVVNNTLVKNVPIYARVTVKDDTLQVKQIKIYVPVGEDCYEEYVTKEAATIKLDD
mgnify:CR=1 FL=1